MTPQRFFTFLLVFLFVSTLVPISASAQELQWWNPKWIYRQEITIPFDTSKENAKFQPIDLPVTFDHPCWAEDEQNYSLRVIYQDGETPVELESQIYDLNHTDETHIKTCNLVFLIPEQATGKEHYYVYYSEDETPSPAYPDHLQIEEAYYYFAPIPGFPFESYYYKITQDGYIVYGIAVNGEFLGVSTAQQITLFKNNITTVTTPQDSLAFASFDYFYYYGAKLEDFASTIQKLISKEIFIDGNLMVSCGIVSETSGADFRTTATYKYYYCPDPQNRRVYAHVRDEALKAVQVTNVAPYSESSGNMVSLQVGAVKSPSIKELNFGQMFQYLDVYAQNNRTLNFLLDTNPDYSPEQITVISTKDNIDLGKKAWACFDDGTTGFAHSLIFGSTHILVSGTGERDGLQVKAFEGAGPGLLGLRTTAETFCFSRNSYEKGGTNDLTIPANYVIEFDAEFFSTMNGGYPAVDNESTVFQAAVQTRPSSGGKVSSETQNHKTYSLKAFVHLAPSTPMGTAFSLITGKNFSYISAELYRENQLLINDIAGRVSLSSIPSFEGATLLKKIKIALGFLDLRNLTFFKKIQFDNLQPGTYLVKIYKEHPLFGHEQKYIGYKIVNLEKNMTTRILCGPEGHADISIRDQQGTPVKDADARLLSGNIPVAETKTTSDTSTTISAPSSLRGTYILQLLYKGFLLYNKPLSLRPINSVFPRKISNDISLYDFTLDLKDLWGISPSETLNPLLTSPEMKEPVVLTAKPLENGQYLFEHLPPATYNLQVSYKSFLLQENITIPLQGSNMLTLVIPTEFNVTIITYDSRGLQLPKTTIALERDGNTLALNESNNGRFFAQLPPGTYTATVWYDNAVVGKRTLTVIGERSFDLVTTEEPLFPLIVIGVTIAFGVIGAFLTLRKKDTSSFLKVLAGILAIVSLMLPWWTIQGSSIEPMVSTQTHLYFVPANLISFTTTPTVIAGERSSASAPALFTTFITVLTVAVLASALCIILQMIFHRYRRKKLSLSFLVIGIVFLALSLSVFYIVMSVITKVGVGGVFGQGPISANIPGENILVPVSSSWGLDSGFYLCFTALILLCSSLLLSRKKHKNEVQEKAV
jgi:hypothetical protein